MAISFDKQVAIITGAGRGLGREYALEIARRGGSVVVADIGSDAGADTTWADRVVAEIEGTGGRAVAANHSVTERAGGEAMVDVAIKTFGRVDAVIHNAGFLRPAFFEDMSETALRDVIDVHLYGAFHVAQPAWRHMKQQGYGRIVLTGSGAVFGTHAGTNYSAAKAAMLGLATALSYEGEEHNIRANVVLPLAQSNIGKDNPIPGSKVGALKDRLEAQSERWQPKFVEPLVTYLASSDCSVGGQFYSAVMGRFARVGFAIADGWVSQGAAPTADDIKTHLQEIDDLTKHSISKDMPSEWVEVLDRLA
jgi:NAD(P)-dependent dehydrogenase (short-subunit alcohol dehydrogenase family)